MIRYAEALLAYAEAAEELGKERLSRRISCRLAEIV